MSDATQAVELDLHGRVRLRLIDPPAGFAERLQRQLPSFAAASVGAPDLTVRFVDRIETTGRLRRIGADETWVDGEGLLVGLPGARGRARLPVDRIGTPCEIVCERSLSRVPLLRSMLLLAALSNGVAPAHASTVVLGGRGIATTGWTSGGKTGIQLGLMRLGGSFVSDDVTLIGRDGWARGLHEPVNLKQAYLDEEPELRARIPARARLRMELARSLATLGGALPRRLVSAVSSGRTRRRLARWSGAQRAAKATPLALFGAERCVDETRIGLVLVGESGEGRDVSAEAISSREAALRMAISSREELAPLDDLHRRLRFAFPERTNELLDAAEQRLAEILLEALGDAAAFRVVHPDPASIGALSDALEPLVAAGGRLVADEGGH